MASAVIIARWLPSIPTGASVCEVGAGRSVVAEQLIHLGQSLNRLLITDESARMLEYSRQFESAGATLWLARAERLPIAGDSIGCLVSSLGDPYNNRTFWTEAFRVVRPGGIVIFTSPAYEWAVSFRRESQNIDASFMQAEFELADGRRVYLPSYIYSDSDQQSLVEGAGFVVRDVRSVTIADLHGAVLSPKLCLGRGRNGPVVTGFLMQKHSASEKTSQ
jgi:ubiquinone/menaquinone biosynthesis C-methylase UbiE